MTMTFYLDCNELALQEEGKGLRLTTDSGDNYFIGSKAVDETIAVITQNYQIVKEFYLQRTACKIAQKDLERVSLKIVLFYFGMYHSWRLLYEKDKNRDLTFLEKDFSHPYTTDQIIAFFRLTYPDSYLEKCAIMLDMDADELRQYEQNRQELYDMW